jgi:hypothetical protein
MDKQENITERQAAAAYLSSFVARAVYLRHATAVVTFEILLSWLHRYIKFHEEEEKFVLFSLFVHRELQFSCCAFFQDENCATHFG